MAIREGDPLPSGTLHRLGDDGAPKPLSIDEYFAGKRVVLFAVPGAFTQTCSARHLPSFVKHADAIKAKGIDEIVCIAVNDAGVMDAWGKAKDERRSITMLSDGNADFTTAVGMEIDRRASGMGLRSKRYAMVVDDGVIKKLNLEPDGSYGVSSAEAILKDL